MTVRLSVFRLPLVRATNDANQRSINPITTRATLGRDGLDAAGPRSTW
jgi:hypothetical protein